NGIIPEQDRVITQVVILDADKKQIQCVVRPLQILRADGTWENIGGMTPIVSHIRPDFPEPYELPVDGPRGKNVYF
ncbi:phage tail fiber C-terminal domain-containing protein, partial [Escherichia coli]|uniref:phage tail fiber C-terminal domain-containing protein n=1 Tax=Escherichia coli TaxID=562 RepID=UPI002023A4F1